MALDPALKDALTNSVKISGQPKNVEQRLVAWLVALSEGEYTDEGRIKEFYENLMDAIKIDGENHED